MLYMATVPTIVQIEEKLKEAVNVAIFQREGKQRCFSIAVNEALQMWLDVYMMELNAE